MKYVMIWPYAGKPGVEYYLFKDWIRTNRVISYPINKPCRSPVLNFLQRVHHSFRLNEMVKLSYHEWWYSSLFRILDKDTCVIFAGTLPVYMVDRRFLNRVKSTGAKMALIIIDSLHGPTRHIPLVRPDIFGFPWDIIFSYDGNDCKEYGFKHLPGTIYSVMDDVKSVKDFCDLYFIGQDKAGRTKKAIEIYKACQSAGIETDFNCVGGSHDGPGMDLKSRKGIHFFKKGINYDQVVSRVLSANCILELVGKGQQVQTARYYEAVCYNKKLLTNNPTVKELSFYDPRYMRYFETVEDIDFSWVKEKVDIDYHYAGEFSPLHILDELDRIFAGEAQEEKENSMIKMKLEKRGGKSQVIASLAACSAYRKAGLAV